MNTHRIPIEDRDYLFAKEAAKELGISNNSFYAHCRAGNIRHVHLGKSIRVPKVEVERLKREGTRPAAPKADPLD